MIQDQASDPGKKGNHDTDSQDRSLYSSESSSSSSSAEESPTEESKAMPADVSKATPVNEPCTVPIHPLPTHEKIQHWDSDWADAWTSTTYLLRECEKNTLYNSAARRQIAFDLQANIAEAKKKWDSIA